MRTYRRVRIGTTAMDYLGQVIVAHPDCVIVRGRGLRGRKFSSASTARRHIRRRRRVLRAAA